MSSEEFDWKFWRQRMIGRSFPVWQWLALSKESVPSSTTPPNKERQEHHSAVFDELFELTSDVRRLAEARFDSLYSTIYQYEFVRWVEEELGVPYQLPWQMTINAGPTYRRIAADGTAGVVAITGIGGGGGTWGHSAAVADIGQSEKASAESEQVSWECTDTLSKNSITGGRHEESIRDCHLVSATEASEILAQIFPDTTREYWVGVIQKEPKWLSKDINNQFGGRRWFVKANGGAGGSGYGPTLVYLPIMLVRFIQYSKNADEAQSKLDKIKQLNIKPLSEKLAFPTIEQCATWTIKNRLSRSI